MKDKVISDAQAFALAAIKNKSGIMLKSIPLQALAARRFIRVSTLATYRESGSWVITAAGENALRAWCARS